jgi:hypothetical protein
MPPSTAEAPQEQATTTVLICRAAHPAAKRGVAQYRHRIHGIVLQHVPFRTEPTGRILGDFNEVADDCIGVRCQSSDCRDRHNRRLITEYRIIPDPVFCAFPDGDDENSESTTTTDREDA